MSGWPVVGTVIQVVRCVLADSGTIVSSAVTHATAFGVETLTVVKDCVVFVVGAVT